MLHLGGVERADSVCARQQDGTILHLTSDGAELAGALFGGDFQTVGKDCYSSVALIGADGGVEHLRKVPEGLRQGRLLRRQRHGARAARCGSPSTVRQGGA